MRERNFESDGRGGYGGHGGRGHYDHGRNPESGYDGKNGSGRGGNGGSHGGEHGRMRNVDEKSQVLFVGSVNCLRHKPYMQIGELMQQGKASILSPTMGDFSSGRYLTQVEEAVEELAAERNCRDFVIICGCQWVILSTDGDLIVKHLAEKGINAVIDIDDHLEHGDHE